MAKILYTYAELSKMNTQRLTSTFNRIFNTTREANSLSSYDNRSEMLIELMAEMRIIKAMGLLPQNELPVEPYKAMKIVVTPDGMAVLWNMGVSNNNRQISDEQMNLIRELREDGETYKQIARYVGVPQITVFRVLKGEYAAEATRWNTDPDAPDQIKPVRKAKTIFKPESMKAPVKLFSGDSRPNNDFWTGMGL